MSITDGELAIEAAAAGAAVVRSHYGSSPARFDKGGGDFATTTDLDAEEAILRVLRRARPADVDVNLDPPFPNRDAFLAARMLADDGFVERFRPRVVSTTLAVAWVAAGRRAAYVTDGHLRDSVHFAAGIALCRAAGCVVTGLDGQPVHTGTGGLIAAADEPTHTALLALVRNQRAVAGR